MSDPMISCLMVTQPRPKRLVGLRKTLQDFARQTYSHREMVIVIDAASEAEAAPVLREVAQSGTPMTRAVVAGRRMTLGALRNLSWAEAKGEVICTWDDDDRHHPTRLAEQSSAIRSSGLPACYLQEFLHYFATEHRIFRVNFRPAPDPVAVNTLMCRRQLAIRYPETGPDADRGEDTALFRAIRDHAAFASLADQPWLFVYVNHGTNTCTDEHHRHLVDQMGASKGVLSRHETALRQGLAAFDFGPFPVTVTGRNGDAFVIGPAHVRATDTVSL